MSQEEKPKNYLKKEKQEKKKRSESCLKISNIQQDGIAFHARTRTRIWSIGLGTESREEPENGKQDEAGEQRKTEIGDRFCLLLLR